MELVVDEQAAGQRLDVFLAGHVAGLSRRDAQQLCATGRVRLAGRRARKSELVRAHDRVTLALGDPRPEPDSNAVLDVRLELPELVVVSKPAGLPSATLRRSDEPALCRALLARYPEMRGVGHLPREPGLVHRLDNQTSGLVLAARSQPAFEALAAALSDGRLRKRYLALVSPADIPDAGQIERAMAPDPADPSRVLALEHPPRGYARVKLTEYRTLQRTPRFALVELEAHAAFRHQIRAQLAAIGHPIAGDRVYGGEPDRRLGERHALHASHIAWAGDSTLSAFAVDDALPDELGRLLDDEGRGSES